jgi:hypothetical protein
VAALTGQQELSGSENAVIGHEGLFSVCKQRFVD